MKKREGRAEAGGGGGTHQGKIIKYFQRKEENSGQSGGKREREKDL